MIFRFIRARFSQKKKVTLNSDTINKKQSKDISFIFILRRLNLAHNLKFIFGISKYIPSTSFNTVTKKEPKISVYF